MYKKDEILNLGEAIAFFLETHGLRDQADMRRIIAQWENLMGKPIANHTEKLHFSEGILWAHINSPIWRNELSLCKLKIRDMINRQIGREVVKEVRIM